MSTNEPKVGVQFSNSWDETLDDAMYDWMLLEPTATLLEKVTISSGKLLLIFFLLQMMSGIC